MVETMRLSDLAEGESAYVAEVQAAPGMYRRLTDLGLIRGTRVTCVLTSPAGDPRAYLIRGALIALRTADTAGIVVEKCVERVLADPMETVRAGAAEAVSA